MLVDTHSHLNFPAFDKDRNEIIKKCLESEIWVINVGTNFETSKKAVEITTKYEKGVYASIGLHPIDLDTGLIKIKTDEKEGSHFEKKFDYEKYKNLAKSEKVVAIGEIGLDYYWKPKTKRKLELFKEKQKDLLLKELELAKELNLPVIFHCRMAHEDLIKILTDPDRNSYDRRNHGQIKGVIHCFTGDWEQAEKYLKVGFYLGFNGLIFKMNFDEIIKKTPIEKIL
ncbi:TatD family hydrolase, partial [Candidatus Gracilibacteria bacterium]|nr:TatD family hydrolase [Candidatus Gracilibacteria bacterium]